jgi:hypothetical protein
VLNKTFAGSHLELCLGFCRRRYQEFDYSTHVCNSRQAPFFIMHVCCWYSQGLKDHFVNYCTNLSPKGFFLKSLEIDEFGMAEALFVCIVCLSLCLSPAIAIVKKHCDLFWIHRDFMMV